MNKLAIAVFTASLTAVSLPLFAGDNNAQQNAAADAGMDAPGSHQQMAPQGTDSSNINNPGMNMNSATGTNTMPQTGNGTNSNKIDKKPQCSGDNCMTPGN